MIVYCVVGTIYYEGDELIEICSTESKANEIKNLTENDSTNFFDEIKVVPKEVIE